MKEIRVLILLLVLLIHSILVAQTGPGGVGLNDGTSNLSIWFRTDNGVITSGTDIDQIINSAGISALDISETSTQRPTLVSDAINGYDEISFNGNNRLRSGLNLTTTNFITNEASSFVVCRADNATQTSSVYSTEPLNGETRFLCHIPWNASVFFDIGVCCNIDSRIEVTGLTGLTNYSYWSFDANPLSGKQLYRNGVLLQSRANTTNYIHHATQRFNLGSNTGVFNGFIGDITEVIVFRTKINTTQRIIVENYLSAKYNIPSAQNDLYTMDNVGNGNHDHDVAGIGRISSTDFHNDSRGTGIVRILNPSNLDDGEFLFWGHDNGVLELIETTDVPGIIEARFARVWRVSEVNTSSSAVDVGSIDVRFDLYGLGGITASDLRLLVDTDNDGFFNDETPISGATSLGGNIYEFSGISAIENNLRFTLGTINSNLTPLPIQLVYFNAIVENERAVKLEWVTASEMNNDFFTVERTLNVLDWEIVTIINGAGNSNTTLTYSTVDNNPYNYVSYYRLKQTDFDGQFEYSDIKSVNLTATGSNNVQIYPNPSNNFITLQGNSEELAEIKIINALGQEVTNMISITNENDSTVIIDISNLSQGVYYVKTKTTANSVYKK